MVTIPVKGLKCWSGAWLRNGWRNSKNQPVLNYDLWKPFLQLVQQRHARGDTVDFQFTPVIK